MMTLVFSSNRLRHIIRRVREAPFAFLVHKGWMLTAPYFHWVGYVSAARKAVPQHGPAFSAAFLAGAEALREGVRAAALSDGTYRDSLVERTRRLLDEGRVPCLGYGWLPMPSGDAWRADVTSGYLWPQRYFPFVNFLTHGADADVKVPWEMSRLQWLVWLAEAAFAHPEADERRRAGHALVAALRDWRTSNPCGYGPNWTVSMEVGIRALNLTLALAIGWDAFSAAERGTLSSMLAEHRTYLRRFPEISDLAGNHYLVNICGLIVLEGLVFDETRSDDRRVLRWIEALCVQFEPDGLHLEHAPMYHRLCVETVLWAAASLGRANAGAPLALADLVDRACRALATLKMTPSTLPVLGDADSGQLVMVGEPDRSLRYLRQLLGLEAGGAPLLVLLAGTSGTMAPAIARLGVSSYLQSGESLQTARLGPFLRLSRGPVDVTVRAGPHGLGGRASHDHDDNGAPWVTWGAHDLLIEGGCFAYTRSPTERLLDLASQRHNVVTVRDRLRFAPIAGAMSPTVSRAPVATETMLSDLADRPVELRLRWRDDLAGGVEHLRRLTLPSVGTTFFSVDDAITLEVPATLVLRWHFAPEWQLAIGDDLVVRLHDQHGSALGLKVTSTAPFTLFMKKFRFSPRYGEAIDASVIEVHLAVTRDVHTRSAFFRLPPDS